MNPVNLKMVGSHQPKNPLPIRSHFMRESKDLLWVVGGLEDVNIPLKSPFPDQEVFYRYVIAELIEMIIIDSFQ